MDEVLCHVCSQQGGCFHKSTDNKWVHPICTIGTQDIKIESFAKMQINLSGFRKGSQKLTADKKCDICGNKVETFASSLKASHHVHLHCALRASYQVPSKCYWRISFNVEQNNKVVSFMHYPEQDVNNHI